MQQPIQQVFNLTDLTGNDIEAMMTGLNELPSKASRLTMNKIEAQIIQQVQAQQAAQLAELSKQKAAEKAEQE